MAEPRIIIFDLETIPDWTQAAKVWCQLSAYPGRTLKATIGSIICGGWKVLGQKKTHCINAWDFPEWRKDINNDYRLCKKISEVLNSADCIVGHNSKRFDIKYLQTRLLYHDLPLISRVHHVDTCLEARRNILSFNNKLDYLAEHFLDARKLEHTGWQLWIDVMNRIVKAQTLMTKYCKQDVNVTEKLFYKLRPLISGAGIPNFNNFILDYAPGASVCPKCGSTRLKRNGYHHTLTKVYQQLQCKDCRSNCRTDIRGNNPRSI